MAFQSISGSMSGSSSSSGLQFLNSPSVDTTYTKVFVGGLAWETRSESLRGNFEKFGEILEAVVILDRNTGKSKGYGFVTFSDPESARKACLDPNPIIDGRRTNCNLASLGRPRASPTHGHPRTFSSFRLQSPQGPYMGGQIYQQSVPCNYPQTFQYDPYGYTFGSEYIYAQGMYPYTAQQYVPMYGVPGMVGAAVYPLRQLSQPVLSRLGYPGAHGYSISPSHVMQLTTVNAVPSMSLNAVQPPFPTGSTESTLTRSQFIASNTQLMQGRDSDQTAI